MTTQTKILIVDDSHFLNQILIRQIGSEGFAAKSATSLAEANELLRDWLPLIVICNNELPDGDAAEFIAFVNSESPLTQIIIMGNHDVSELRKGFEKYKIAQYAQKPIPKEKLVEMVYQLKSNSIANAGVSSVILESPATQPWEIHIKSCYVCAYDNVKVFVQKKGAYKEDWKNGFFPEYIANEGFSNFDFLKTYISVCPSCLFASNSINDFSEKNQHLELPFNPEAKKVLAMGISGRRRILGLAPDAKHCFLFDSPNREIEAVSSSFKLAQKCANALVLGNKPGSHADTGMAYLLEFALEEKKNNEMLRNALQLFQGQLKVSTNSRELNSRCYYFCIMIHFALGESQKANNTKEALEEYYSSVGGDGATEQEIEWNQRLLHVWQYGVDIHTQRRLN